MAPRTDEVKKIVIQPLRAKAMLQKYASKAEVDDVAEEVEHAAMQEGNSDRPPDFTLPDSLGHHAAVEDEVGDGLQRSANESCSARACTPNVRP
jgi:hypothetical protein